MTSGKVKINTNYNYICKKIFFKDEVTERAVDVFQRHRVPRVLEFIDGTHINITAHRVEEWTDVNRKGDHSINAQVGPYDSSVNGRTQGWWLRLDLKL